MTRLILAAALTLAPGLALAQPAPNPQQLQAQLDAAQAQVSRIMVGLTTTIAQQQAEIAALKQQAEAKKADKPKAP